MKEKTLKEGQKICAIVTTEKVDSLICPIFDGNFSSPLVKYFVPVIQSTDGNGNKSYVNLRTGEVISVPPGQKVWTISPRTVLCYCHWHVYRSDAHRVQRKAVDAVYMIRKTNKGTYILGTERPCGWEPKSLKVLDVFPAPEIRKVAKGQTVMKLTQRDWDSNACRVRAVIASGKRYQDLRTGEEITPEKEEFPYPAASHTIFEWPDGYRIMYRNDGQSAELEDNYCGSYDPRYQKFVRIG